MQESHPISIGALGGSGTRVLAGIVQEMGVFIGHILNNQLDNLIFTYFFKYNQVSAIEQKEFFELVKLFTTANLGPKRELSTSEHNLFKRIYTEKYHKAPDLLIIKNLFMKILGEYAIDKPIPERWGWKEPNTHIILPELLAYFPQMKYIHVVRNGLDMAYSKNKNQARLWGEAFLGRPFDATPAYSLSYWCAVHRRIKKLQQVFPENIHIITFEELCADSAFVIGKLLDFCNISYSSDTLQRLSKRVIAPDSIGRYRDFCTSQFNHEDINFVQEMGFTVA